MGWQRAVPGIILLLVKLTGTSVFLFFIPDIFPRGNFSFVHEENWTVLLTTESLPEAMTTSPGTTASKSTVKAKAPSKLPKWERYSGSDYWFSEDIDVWFNSQMECLEQRSDLVIINDRKELEFIYNKTRMVDYFIGLVFSEDGKKWIWTDGTQYKRSLFTMKPDEVGKTCATVRAGEVGPASCHQENRWICEKSI